MRFAKTTDFVLRNEKQIKRLANKFEELGFGEKNWCRSNDC